jgi:hypothetical protein
MIANLFGEYTNRSLLTTLIRKMDMESQVFVVREPTTVTILALVAWKYSSPSTMGCTHQLFCTHAYSILG